MSRPPESPVPSAAKVTRRTVLGLVAGLPLVAAGCVSVPTSGPVTPVNPSGSIVERGGDIDVRPPETDATPLAIVQGFLEAMATGAYDLSTARLFLVQELRDSWQPTKALIYSSADVPTVSGSSVVLDSKALIGQLDERSSFSRGQSGTFQDFGMRQDDAGQWRIGNPPTTLLISRNLFQTFYRTYDLYFFEPSYRRLVPDPIFLPYSRGAAQLSAALLQALIQGPTAFLRASVRNAIPAGTQLEAQSVVVDNGIADIQLSDPVLALNEQQRTLLAAQIAWTLDQVSDIQGLRINNGTLQIDGTVSPGPDAYVPITASEGFGPVPDVDASLYGLQGRAAVVVAEVDNRAQTQPVAGSLGAAELNLSTFAVSESGERVAAVTTANELFVGPLGGPLERVLTGVGRLLRPQVIQDEAWTVSQRDGKVTVRVVRDKTSLPVDRGSLPDGEIQAFRLAADGTRIAFVQKVEGGSRLGLMAVDRGDDAITLRSWRSIDLDVDTFNVRTIIDVAWQGPTTLIVLGGADAQATMEPYTVSQDGYDIQKVGLSAGWGARQLTATPATATKALILGTDNRSFRFASQSTWALFSTDLRFLTYAG